MPKIMRWILLGFNYFRIPKGIYCYKIIGKNMTDESLLYPLPILQNICVCILFSFHISCTAHEGISAESISISLAQYEH